MVLIFFEDKVELLGRKLATSSMKGLLPMGNTLPTDIIYF